MDLYIDIKNIPDFSENYVAWVDMMGAKNIFRRNEKTPTLYILQLYKCLESITENCQILTYPMLDGFYVISDSDISLFTFMKEYFVKMLEWQANTKDYAYSFLIRAGVGHGMIIKGTDINNSICTESIKKNLVFGSSIIDAFEAEHQGAPFGIHIGESAEKKLSNATHIINSYYDWLNQEPNLQLTLRKFIDEYYEWWEENPHWNAYRPEDRERHQRAFNQMANTLSWSSEHV